MGNPFYNDAPFEEVAPLIIKRVPQLEMIDSKMISSQIRKAAEELH